MDNVYFHNSERLIMLLTFLHLIESCSCCQFDIPIYLKSHIQTLFFEVPHEHNSSYLLSNCEFGFSLVFIHRLSPQSNIILLLSILQASLTLIQMKHQSYIAFFYQQHKAMHNPLYQFVPAQPPPYHLS